MLTPKIGFTKFISQKKNNQNSTAMKTKTILLSSVISLYSFLSFSQNSEIKTTLDYKSLIGIQLSPLLVNNESYVANIYSIRYGYKILKPLTIGVESYNYFYRPYKYLIDYLTDHNGMSIGIFTRYSFRPEKRLQGFLEISPFYQKYYTKKWIDHGGEFGLYLALGLSIFSKNKHLSADLYYRLSTITAINGKNGAISYKINFHF